MRFYEHVFAVPQPAVPRASGTRRTAAYEVPSVSGEEAS